MADFEGTSLDTIETPTGNSRLDNVPQTTKTLIVSSAHLVHDTYAGFIAPFGLVTYC